MTSTDLIQQMTKKCHRLAAAARNASDRAFWLGLAERWKAIESRSAQQHCLGQGLLVDQPQKHQPMTLGRASELYCAEVVGGKRGAEAAVRELDWIETVLGADMYLRDLTQADITKVRNGRRVMTTTRGPGKDAEGRPLQKLVSPSTVNRTMQVLRATLYRVRNHHEAFIRPGLKFGVTKEPERKREATIEEENAILEALREDFRPIFAFALWTGIRETGVCTLT